MRKTFRAWNPHQSWLLPPTPEDWMPSSDWVYLLLDIIGTLDISPIMASYEKEARGYPPFHPRMMVCLLIYSYAMGIRSSRRIAELCGRDVGWRVIVGSDVPDFRTISEFRRRHLAAFSGLFLEVLRIAREAGMVTLGHVSLDGTKIKANASRHKAMSYGRMVEEERLLQAQIAELLQGAERVDKQEDAQVEAANRTAPLPEELARRETRLARIRKAKADLEARHREMSGAESSPVQDAGTLSAHDEKGLGGDSVSASDDQVPPAQGSPAPKAEAQAMVPDKAQINFTDPESRIMKVGNKGWDQCGNAQLAVDAEAQIIVAADVTDQANDVHQVVPMLTQAMVNAGGDSGRIEKVSMDAGYFSEANVTWLEGKNLDGYVAAGRIKHGVPAPTTDGPPPQVLGVRQKMAHKLRTPEGQAVYARRKTIVEPVFGQIKQAMGFRQFSLRGMRQMRGEWQLMCLSFNLRKIIRVRQMAIV